MVQLGTSAKGSQFFGTGTYNQTPVNIDEQAFNNPNFVPGQYQSAYNNYLPNAAQGVTASTATAAPTYPASSTMGRQLGLADQYATMAAGGGPSLASVTAQQQGEQGLKAAMSMLGSARGSGNPAAAQLAARQAQGNIAQQVAQNAVLGRTQEELGAMAAQGGLLGNVTGQQLQQQGITNQAGQFNAAQQNAIAQGNQANTLNAYTHALDSAAAQGLAQQQGAMGGQQLQAQTQLGLNQIQQQAYADAAARQQRLAGGLLQGIGGAAGAVFGL